MEISCATNKVSKASRGSARPNPAKGLNARTALLGLFVALTIVFASTTVYELGIRTTLTSTSTSTSTSIQRVNDHQHDDPDDNSNFDA